jgi:hypothetical protein
MPQPNQLWGLDDLKAHVDAIGSLIAVHGLRRTVRRIGSFSHLLRGAAIDAIASTMPPKPRGCDETYALARQGPDRVVDAGPLRRLPARRECSGVMTRSARQGPNYVSWKGAGSAGIRLDIRQNSLPRSHHPLAPDLPAAEQE